MCKFRATPEAAMTFSESIRPFEWFKFTNTAKNHGSSCKFFYHFPVEYDGRIHRKHIDLSFRIEGSKTVVDVKATRLSSQGRPVIKPRILI